VLFRLPEHGRSWTECAAARPRDRHTRNIIILQPTVKTDSLPTPLPVIVHSSTSSARKRHSRETRHQTLSISRHTGISQGSVATHLKSLATALLRIFRWTSSERILKIGRHLAKKQTRVCWIVSSWLVDAWVWLSELATPCHGSPENAGLEMTDESAGLENARLENDGRRCRAGKCRTGKWRTKVHGWKMTDLKLTYF